MDFERIRHRLGAARRWVAGHGALIFLLTTALYWPVAILASGALVQWYASSFLLVLALGVVLSFLPLAGEYLTQGRLDRIGFLVVGIVLAWLAVVAMRLRSLLVAGTTLDWLGQPIVTAFLLWLSLQAAVLHIVAANMTGGRLPRPSKVAGMLALIIVGIFIGGIGVWWWIVGEPLSSG